jgi:hypothetical protein
VSTSFAARLSQVRTGGAAAASAVYALGALSLAAEGAVHIQQFASSYYAIRWIGPLFVANAVACLVAMAGIAYPRTRPLGALAGVAISVLALAGLVVSYGQGLFGWQEFGFHAGVAVAVIAEACAVILLSAALAVEIALPQPSRVRGTR